MKKHYRHENDCLNCGTVLEGKFCHNCGQENLQIKENFGHLMNHAISDYFHFDHQFFHTLKPLLFKPGKLTNEYMAGKRVQYLHPIKMYIFISLVFFVLFFKKNAEEKEKVETRRTSKEQIDSTKKAINASPLLPKQLKENINKSLDEAAADSGKHKKRTDDDHDSEVTINGNAVNADFSSLTDRNYPDYESYLAAQQKLPEKKRDDFFERLIVRKNFDYKKKGINPKEAVEEEVKHNVPKMMFVLLPIFAFILRITFRKNRKFYVEHLIFSFHLHCFAFLFLSISMILQWIIPGKGFHTWADIIVTLSLIFYIYKALRVVYHRSRFRTISKMIGMAFVYVTVFGICMGLLYSISALTAA